MSKVSPARNAAFSILKTMEKHGHSDTLLRARKVEALSAADRNLTTALVLGVLRWQVELDNLIRPLLKHPNAKLDADVLIALRIGAFQLLHMDRIPARAAIDESVELTKQAGHRFASGMVNAVLRKLAASRPDASSEPDPNHCKAGFPSWMVDRWIQNYGEDATCSICRSGQQQPHLSVRLTSDAVQQELTADGIELAPGELLTASRRLIAGDVTRTAAFRGTGTLGRNPEIRHRLRPEDLPRQAERQIAILASALRAARPGGYVLYSTCSLEPEENEQVIAAVLFGHPEANLVSLATRIEELQSQGILVPGASQRLLACIQRDGALRLLPGLFQTDGFFAALIQKQP
ncbi:transcription antitermination factor NusB [Occallatibacter savannae]|uniref:transcription antitermination factor NusB n=1 Tax=Occallatibacter savannae TaxID=1002691 RepID=UPI0013A55F22|nr:transcription antitermination factor NusB [Occallatibacter savannae]